MAYEKDMLIVWDMLSKDVAVSFRGRSYFVAGPFPDRKTAVQAGEDHCRKLGWRDI
ncbi:hypothetical protein ACVITL_005850 [Rhizobium pisi]